MSKCLWPVEGSGLKLKQCGEPATSGKPYCADHCAMAYTKQPADKPYIYNREVWRKSQ